MNTERVPSPEYYDLVALGAGPAGESATELAAALGYRTLVIERNRPGGTVTTTGGAPTKTLREAALYFSGFQEKEVYGLEMKAPPELVLDAIRNRTQVVCENLQQVTYDNIIDRGVEYLQGDARLGPDKTIQVILPDGGERTIHAKHILIATGSHPVRPIKIPFEHPGICDTDTILSRGRPPKSMLIVGAGPVGVEFATIAHAMGLPVTIVDKSPRILTMMDRELADRMLGLFTSWGVKFVGDCTLQRVSAKGEVLEVTLSTGEQITVDTLLFAAGRASNSEGLGLSGVGVSCDDRGRVVVDANYRTTAEGIYAAGDVVRPTLASVAMEQGRAVVCHAFGIPFEGTVDPTPVSAVYGMPEIAAAGLTEEQCKAQGLEYEVGRAEFNVIPRGAIAGRGGLLKLIFLKSNRELIGAHCLGDIASEVVGIGQMAIRCKATIDTIMNMSMNTPTYSYAYKYAAFDGLPRLQGRHMQKRSTHVNSEASSSFL